MRERKIDKALWSEITSDKPDEAKIRALVAKGAKVTGSFLKTMACVLRPIRDDVGNFYGIPVDLKLFQLIIDLGGDVNYTEDGFNCLFEAILGWQVELLELFLKAGANPNCICTESPESLLSWTLFDKHHEEGGKGEPYLEKIIALLRLYGAKQYRELNEPNHVSG